MGDYCSFLFRAFYREMLRYSERRKTRGLGVGLKDYHLESQLLLQCTQGVNCAISVMSVCNHKVSNSNTLPFPLSFFISSLVGT